MAESESRGFTLTEILVVGAIVAIMAAVAIPVYTGYVRNQRQEMVENLAQAAAVAANAYHRRHNNEPDSARLGLFLPDPTKYFVSVDPDEHTVTVRDATDPDNIRSTLSYR